MECVVPDPSSGLAELLDRVRLPFLEKLAQVTRTWQAIRLPMVQLGAELAEGLRTLPARTTKAIVAASNRGWFIDEEMDMGQILSLGDASPDGIDDGMAGYWKASLERIESSRCKAFPRRENPIRKAFSAHKAGDFELSIPVFLAQADGICRENLNVHLYSKKKVAAATDGIRTFYRVLLEPLRTAAPINFNETERPPGMEFPNRHAIMHGEALDYGTEVNGLRTISLFGFVSWILGPSERPDEDAA